MSITIICNLCVGAAVRGSRPHLTQKSIIMLTSRARINENMSSRLFDAQCTRYMAIRRMLRGQVILSDRTGRVGTCSRLNEVRVSSHEPHFSRALEGRASIPTSVGEAESRESQLKPIRIGRHPSSIEVGVTRSQPSARRWAPRPAVGG